MDGVTRLIAAVAMLALSLGAARALASGPSPTAPWYVDEYGGDPSDLTAYYDGRVGLVMPTAPRPMLLISWRLLHRLKVGQTAGDNLSKPCCGTPWWALDHRSGPEAWLEVRKTLPSAPPLKSINAERDGMDSTSIENCFSEAFDTASATLKDRAARYGAGSAEMRAWLEAQDAVFAACHDPMASLPPLMTRAPSWLLADRAYQTAALALYQGRNTEAATRFTAIAHDAASPWHGSGLYLTARALVRQALIVKTHSGYAKAHEAVEVLSRQPAGSMGRNQVHPMEHLLAFNEDPQGLLTTLARELSEVQPTEDIAVKFRDYTDLGDAVAVKPEVLDWIATLRATAPRLADRDEPMPSVVTRYSIARTEALTHADARWRASRDSAWLVAALSLTEPSDGTAGALLAAANAMSPEDPAWLSVQHHRLRLTLASAPAAESRHRLDAILARRDLSVSDRNVFTAQRAQVAASLVDFARHALRRRLCSSLNHTVDDYPPKAGGCLRPLWDGGDIQPAGVYDGPRDRGSVGFGEDARAVIDRASLADRIALSKLGAFPRALRLDLALTSYGRAVQLQRGAAIDALADELQALLPPMAADFRAVRNARPGPDKRFAEFLILAKIPGIRTDLVDYTRPEGRRVADYQSYWTDWVILKHGLAGAPPGLVRYQASGAGIPNGYQWSPMAWPDSATDLSCLGECGRGAAPLRLPNAFDQYAHAAAAERGYFISMEHPWRTPKPSAPSASADAWEEMLAYATAHSRDSRVPESLYWLVHVGHFGGSHNHSGRRAFRLLHARYEGSSWAKKTQYYND